MQTLLPLYSSELISAINESTSSCEIAIQTRQPSAAVFRRRPLTRFRSACSKILRQCLICVKAFPTDAGSTSPISLIFIGEAPVRFGTISLETI